LFKRAIEEGSSLVHALILKGHAWRSGNDFWKKRADIKNWMASVVRKGISCKGTNNVSEYGPAMGPG
jgi:hypothetical protein